MLIVEQILYVAGITLWAATAQLGGTDAREASVELSRRMYAPVVIAKIAGIDTIFTIDTGAAFTTVTGPQSLLDHPEKTWVIKRAGIMTHSRRRFIQQIDGITIQLFDLPESPTSIAFVPPAEMLRATVTTQNVIGIRDLRNIKLHINLRTGICERTHNDRFEADSEFVKMKFSMTSDTVPKVGVRLRGLGTQQFTFDSGSSFFLTLDLPSITVLKQANQLKEAGFIRAFTLDGLIQIRTYILKSCEIAGCEFADVQVLETSVQTLGSQFIDCFDTTIDFPKREMWLNPLETEWPLRIPPDASGLILSYRDTDLLLVVRMEPDGAAVRSGLLEGDRVLLFDGKSPKDTSMRAMRKRLTEAGTTVKLKVLRDGKELDIDLPLGRSYEYPPKWPELNTDADDFFKSLQNEKKPAAE